MSDIEYLSRILISGDGMPSLPAGEMEACLGLAHKHHVVVRWLRKLLANPSEEVAKTALPALAEEEARIANALEFLERICDELNAEGCETVVIKSLDHWPDLGSDLDLYSNGAAGEILRTMKARFGAEVAARSWGDRLAGKWNFNLPGLPEAVEVHVGRLGQTGEHVDWAHGIPQRAERVRKGRHTFPVTSAEDRLMISTLQRMYRHFYFRLCDVVDSADLVESGYVDFARLRKHSEAAGIWKGVASYLAIVSDYVETYRGKPVPLPPAVRAASSFGGERLSFNRGFLRIPIVPHSVALYTAELGTLARKGEVMETIRLSLLPYLAAAAAVGQKITGSDKGIW